MKVKDLIKIISDCILISVFEKSTKVCNPLLFRAYSDSPTFDHYNEYNVVSIGTHDDGRLIITISKPTDKENN